MKLRRFTWRGRVPARALFFDAALPDAARRAIDAWRTGARLAALDGGVIVIFPREARVDVATAPGEVFVDVSGVLTSAPLSPAEREQLVPGSVVRARGGRMEVVRLDALPELAATALVDTSHIAVVAVEPMGAPAVVEAPPPRAALDARGALLGGGEGTKLDEERARVMREIADGEALPEPDSALARAQHRAARGLPAEGMGESLLRMVASALESVGLMDKVRAAHKKYVEDTLDLLKQGNLDAALKKAIPLSSAAGLGASRPPLFMPGPRASLDIHLGPGSAASSSITLEDDLFTRLRARYREAAQKLERERRYKEAAFVHIELLGEVKEGIALLERSGDLEMMRLAAEVAEGKGLEPALVVRQWFLVGETRRAIAIARRHHAFDGAIGALERSGQRIQAAELRHEWARHLKRTGAYAEAVNALRPLLPGATANVRAILDEGIAARAADLPVLLATRLTLDPGHEAGSAEDRALVKEIVDDDGPDAPRARTVLAQALVAVDAPLRPLTSSLFRALCADVAVGASSANLRALVDTLADPALRADLPPISPRSVPRHPSQVVILDGVPGAHVALDAAVLPGGRLLVALGEAGALILTRKGGVAARIAEPCEQIVRGIQGAWCVLVARRGEVLRLARLDVAARRASHWIDVRARCVPRTFDGDMLFIGRGRELLALDALADTASVLWQASLEAPIAAVAHDELRVMCVTAAPAPNSQPSRMHAFDGKSLAPAGISGLPALDLDVPVAVSAHGFAVTLPDFAQPVVTAVVGTAPMLTVAADAVPGVPLLAEGRIAAVAFESEDARGAVVHAPPGLPLVLHTTDGARVTALATPTNGEARLVVTDDRGRAFLVNVDSGEVLARWAIPA